MSDEQVTTTGISRNKVTITVLGIAVTIAATFGVTQGPEGCKPEAQVEVEVDGPGSGDFSFEVLNTEGSADGSAEGSADTDK